MLFTYHEFYGTAVFLTQILFSVSVAKILQLSPVIYNLTFSNNLIDITVQKALNTEMFSAAI